MKRRILHLLASNSYSGAENVVCTIIDNCSDKYEIFYCSPDGPIREILKSRNINFIPLDKFSISTVKKIVKDYGIDIVHAHDFKASFIASFLNVRVVSQLHCNYKILPCRTLVGMVYGVIQRNFDKIVVVSKEILESASFRKKIEDRVVVINNVLDSKMVIDKSREFDTDMYDMIFVGRLIPLKRPLLFIDIVNDLKKKEPNIKACIIGDGELYEECRRKIVNDNLETNIEMFGFKSNPFPYIKNSKVAVLTSECEGLPMTVIEAMILGTIVVNSGVGGLKEMFDGYWKYICYKKDEYVSCIEELLKNDKSTYRDDCDRMIKSFIDIKDYRKKFIEIYEEVLK
jgi:glycosyltransferase involved in cell wall biosynthesis